MHAAVTVARSETALITNTGKRRVGRGGEGRGRASVKSGR